jgi:amidase
MTGNGRQPQAAGVGNKDVDNYKKRRAVRKVENHPLPDQPLRTFSLRRVISITVGTMVSMWFLAKVFVAFAPLTCVVAQYSNASVPPELLDATADELIAGLEAGQFTSLDLVQVYVKRILEVNSTLHMVTEINPDAWSIAIKLDEERACGNVRG